MSSFCSQTVYSQRVTTTHTCVVLLSALIKLPKALGDATARPLGEGHPRSVRLSCRNARRHTELQNHDLVLHVLALHDYALRGRDPLDNDGGLLEHAPEAGMGRREQTEPEAARGNGAEVERD